MILEQLRLFKMIGLTFSNISIYAVLGITLVLYGLWRLLRLGQRPPDYPPGPPTVPIFGNLLQVSQLVLKLIFDKLLIHPRLTANNYEINTCNGPANMDLFSP